MCQKRYSFESRNTFDSARLCRSWPVKYDNDSYVRDYSRCILCCKCVEACGEVAQNTFAIAVAGRVMRDG
jgi:NADP-reducing hydrogenase subunit HndD